MQDDSRTIHRTTDEARGGQTRSGVRWVLGISLFAAILALSSIWIFGAATQGDAEDEVNVGTRQTEAREGESTDSIITPDNAGLPASD